MFSNLPAEWQKIFATRIVVVGECWEIKGFPRKRNRYGSLYRNGRYVTAHRLSLELTGVETPDDLFVIHSCDNRPCVRPSHLRLGTALDNTTDMMTRGRFHCNVENLLQRTMAEKTKSVCVRGHERTEENTYRRAMTGFRQCRACARIIDAKRRLRKKK
jgi:hypothetical protein